MTLSLSEVSLKLVISSFCLLPEKLILETPASKYFKLINISLRALVHSSSELNCFLILTPPIFSLTILVTIYISTTFLLKKK